jgi:hypothetical protein
MDIFNGSIMAKRFCLATANPNGAKALKQKTIGQEYLKESEKDGIIKMSLIPLIR